MTPAQRRALLKLQRLADTMAPRVRYAYRSALERLQLGGNAEAAIRAIERGDVEGAVRALLPATATNVFAHELTVAVADVIAKAGPIATEPIVTTLRVQFQFLAGSPAAADALDRLNLNAILPVRQGAERGLRDVLRRGLSDGTNPRALVKAARPFVGLTDYDQSIIRSFEDALRTNPVDALTRDLRDRRFDRTIQAAIDSGEPLTESRIAQMTARYTAKLQDWRAETWARTTTLHATREATTAAWAQAADDLGIDRARILKTWVTTLDGRERPTHHALNGNTVPIDQPYANGDMVPGDGTGVEGVEWNCRCAQTIALAPR